MVNDDAWNTVWDPNFKNTLIDLEDIRKTAAAAIADPEKFNGREVELIGDRVGVKESLDLIAAVAGKKITMQRYGENEVTRLRRENPRLGGQWIKRELSKLESDYETRPLDDFRLGFKSFKDFLEQNEDLVVVTYRDIK
ncbi:hypothetical protein F5B20DRAFT_557297 [Whalleya microplaca]|nr:hypothetical protein F5B20DRAFT_557297 [Whalleya microplaca]